MKPVKMRKDYSGSLSIRGSSFIKKTAKFFYYIYLMESPSKQKIMGINTFNQYIHMLL